MPVLSTPFIASVSEGRPLRLDPEVASFRLHISSVTIEKLSGEDAAAAAKDKDNKKKRAAETTLHVRTAKSMAESREKKLSKGQMKKNKKAKKQQSVGASSDAAADMADDAAEANIGAGYAIATVAHGREFACSKARAVVPVTKVAKTARGRAEQALTGAGGIVELVVRGPATLVVVGDQHTNLSTKQVRALSGN